MALCHGQGRMSTVKEEGKKGVSHCVEVKVVCRRSKKKVKNVYVIVSRSRSYVKGQRRRLKRCMAFTSALLKLSMGLDFR